MVGTNLSRMKSVNSQDNSSIFVLYTLSLSSKMIKSMSSKILNDVNPKDTERIVYLESEFTEKKIIPVRL